MYNSSLSGTVSKETIDYLGRQIRKVENAVLDKVKLKGEYTKLLSTAGVGRILALTIMLETGTITRFPKVGDFASYCWKVPSNWTSSNKKKGTEVTGKQKFEIVTLTGERSIFLGQGNLFFDKGPFNG